MSLPRTARIHRGFHRLGTVLAGVFAILGLFVIFVVAPDSSGLGHMRFEATVGLLVLAAAFYAIVRSWGWIVAGFVGD